MWQEIAVILIGLAAFGYAAYNLYRAIARPHSGGCGCGCAECAKRNQKKCDPLSPNDPPLDSPTLH